MSNRRDYYEILGVAKDADMKSIKDAFHKLALKYHPDKNKSPDAEAKFKDIAVAYAVLSDPKKRAEYDAGGFAGVQGYSTEDLFGGINFADIFGDQFGGLGDLGLGMNFGGGGVFDRLFGHKTHGPERGADLKVNIALPLEMILHGGEEKIHYSRPISCEACHGSGAKPGTSPRKCSACDGTGKKVITRQQQKDKGAFSFQQITVCPVCHGQGTFIDSPCESCHGRGQIEKDESLKIKIPIGAEEGMSLRVAGHGMPASEKGGVPGDLFVHLNSAPDPRFERMGNDLWRTETISVSDAVLGTHIKVPALEKALDVSIPAGTQPDMVLRLRGNGLPDFHTGQRGDINLRIRVHLPEHLSKKEQKLFEQLRALEGTQ